MASSTRRLGRTHAGVAISVLAMATFLCVFDVGAMVGELGDLSIGPVLIGLLAVTLAVGCWAESMRRVLVAACTIVPAHRGAAAYGTGMLAKQVVRTLQRAVRRRPRVEDDATVDS